MTIHTFDILGASWGRLGGLLGPLGGLLGASWKHGCKEASCRPLGGLPGASWAPSNKAVKMSLLRLRSILYCKSPQKLHVGPLSVPAGGPRTFLANGPRVFFMFEEHGRGAMSQEEAESDACKDHSKKRAWADVKKTTNGLSVLNAFVNLITQVYRTCAKTSVKQW